MVAVIYEPREDSELLVSVLSDFVEQGMEVLDMGTGTGVAAIRAAELGAKVTGCDNNPEAVERAMANSEVLGIDFILSDLFENVSKRFDIIMFNPPYLPDDGREDEESRANTTDSGVISRFLEQAPRHLKKNGFVLMVISSLTPTDVGGETIAERKVPWETLKVVKIKMGTGSP